MSMANYNMDLTGKQFGRLTVISAIYIDSIKKWKCLCECGNEKITTANLLNFNKVRSCGCLYLDSRKDVAERAKIRNSKPPEVASFNRLYADYKNRAKLKNIDFSLSEEEFKKITKNNCEYCGIEPLQKGNKVAGKNGEYLHNGIDRINNSIGYTLTNCVACCGMCNDAKNSYTLEQFKEWMQRLIKYQGKLHES